MHLNLNPEHNRERNPALSRAYRARCRDNDDEWAWRFWSATMEPTDQFVFACGSAPTVTGRTLSETKKEPVITGYRY